MATKKTNLDLKQVSNDGENAIITPYRVEVTIEGAAPILFHNGLALLEAVDTFDSGAGARFSTWYMVHLKGAFTAACGMRAQRDRQDPLAGAASLDAPVSTEDQEGITLGDAIPDPGAELAMQAVEEDDRRAKLHDVLAAAIAELPEEQRAAIRGRYWQGVPVDNRTLGKALRALRHPRVSAGLRAFL